MYYEINVSLNGQHLFATAERSVTGCIKLQRIYKLFVEKFPKEEGYEITVTKWEKVGKFVDVENMDEA